MSRTGKNSLLFTADVVKTKSLWVQRQLSGLVTNACETATHAITLTAPQKAVKAKAAPRRGRVARTRNGGTWTEAQFWGVVRSALRRTFRFWKPAIVALNAARVASKGPRGRKWLYLCTDCGKLFSRKQVQIDHIIPCGSLTDYEHVGRFLQLLTPEGPDAFRVRCKSCHQQKTNSERNTP